MVARGIGLLGPLVLVPLMLRTYGPDLFGLSVAVGSIMAMAVFSDFGLGSGLLTQLTESVAKQQGQRSRDLVVTATAATSGVAILLGLLALAFAQVVDSSEVFPSAQSVGIEDRTVQMVFLFAGVSFLLNLPLSLVHRCLLSFQMLVSSNVWQAIGSLVQVAVTIVIIFMHGSFLQMVAISSLALPLVNLVCWVWFLVRKRNWVLWKGRFHAQLARPLVALGASFLFLNLLMALTYNLDQFIVARFGSLSDAAVLTVGLKVAALLNLFVAAVTMSYWPTVGSAIASGDYAWVRRATPRVAVLVLGIALSTGLLIWGASAAFLRGWLAGSSNLEIPSLLMLGCILWFCVQVFFAPFLAVLSAQSHVWSQTLALGLYLAVSIPLKFVVLSRGDLVVVPYIGVLTYVLMLMPLAFVSMRRLPSRALSDEGMAGT